MAYPSFDIAGDSFGLGSSGHNHYEYHERRELHKSAAAYILCRWRTGYHPKSYRVFENRRLNDSWDILPTY